MQEKSSALSKKAEKIITDRVKDRLIDVVLRADNADESAKLAREKLGYFYDSLVFSSLDLGVKEGKALDLGTQFGMCAISLAKQHYDFEIISLQDGVRLLEISKSFAEDDMVEERIKWLAGKQDSLPFDDHTFDLVISGFDMHHWENPVQVFNEIERVLKTNGVLLISDLRRDAFSPVIPLLKAVSYLTKKDGIYKELEHSFAASYLKSEVISLVENSNLKGCDVSKDVQFVYIRRIRKEKKHVIIEISSP